MGLDRIEKMDLEMRSKKGYLGSVHETPTSKNIHVLERGQGFNPNQAKPTSSHYNQLIQYEKYPKVG